MFEKLNDKNGVYLNVTDISVTTLNDMYNGVNFIVNDNTLPRDLRIYEDSRGLKATFNLKEMDKLIKDLFKASEKYKSIKHAVVHNKSLYVAFGLFAERLTSGKIYTMKVFSTPEAAWHWLNN
jgi:hypothetical protein